MSRRGASLLEALVAMAIVGGPLLAVIGLMTSNTRGTHQTQDHLAAEMYLQDMLELLAVTCSDPHTLVQSESGAGEASTVLEELMAGRATLPVSFAPDLQRRLAALAGAVQVKVDTDCGSPKGVRYPDRGYSPGLHRIELSVKLSNGAIVRAFRFLAQPPDPHKPPGGGPPSAG